MTKDELYSKIAEMLPVENTDSKPFRILLSCVGHDTNLTGSNPVAGIYRQAKRMASRCQ